jgi:hypothetical protein
LPPPFATPAAPPAPQQQAAPTQAPPAEAAPPRVIRQVGPPIVMPVAPLDDAVGAKTTTPGVPVAPLN